MNEESTGPLRPYGGSRTSPDAVSYAQVERAARDLMKLGERPTVRSVIKAMGKGSPNVVADCLRRFWKDTAAMGSGDPLALMRLPPALADAAVLQWTQALRFAQQAVRQDDSAARARLEELQREADARVRSVELREKDWDMAARIRLADARAQLSHLVQEQGRDRAAIRAKDARIALLEAELQEQRDILAQIGQKRVPKARAGALKRNKSRARRPTRSRTVKRSRKDTRGRTGSKKDR